MRKYVFRARLRNEAAFRLPVARVDVEVNVELAAAAVAGAGGNVGS